MKRIATKTTYLEMRSPTAVEFEPPEDGIDIVRLRQPTVEVYRRLYSSVGRDYHWVDRLLLSDVDLAGVICNEGVEIYVLLVGDETAGYVELDRRTSGEIELAYFGLVPQFVGRGLGKYFLNWTLQQAWSHRPERVWVHTCDLDHPAALPNYLKAGFHQYDERIVQQAVGDE